MDNFLNRHRCLVALLCSLLLVLSVGGAHVHYCFDGQEPQTSLHLFDIGPEHAGGDTADHNDQNVAVSGDTVIKASTSELDLPAALLVFVVLCLTVPRTWRLRVPANSESAPTTPDRLRPPLRGPPVTTRA